MEAGGNKSLGGSRFRNMEFIFGLDFQAFYLKQTKETTTMSAVFMNMSLLWLSQTQGIQSTSLWLLNYRQAHDVLERELIRKSGGSGPALTLV